MLNDHEMRLVALKMFVIIIVIINNVNYAFMNMGPWHLCNIFVH